MRPAICFARGPQQILRAGAPAGRVGGVAYRGWGEPQHRPAAAAVHGSCTTQKVKDPDLRRGIWDINASSLSLCLPLRVTSRLVNCGRGEI